ncbi:P-loop NTPase family protein [Oceanivirga miroungae]|uniref:Lipoprotein n=1 Tax=Oceanivirga miroungae TaxID=1130046 RepID=A0A6I8MBD6_9FUSO|nr:hypothetical protein [Oceanivirga miroungae]VWL84795.1 hypothetical protein OMES3154_00043 [Oceanivirga miroungae]
MKFLKKFFTIFILFTVIVSCTHDKDYYKSHPKKAKAKLQQCATLGLTQILSESEYIECRDALDGLYEYTYEKNMKKSLDELDEAIKTSRGSGLFNPEISALYNLRSQKFKEIKPLIEKEALDYFNALKAKGYMAIEEDARKNSYETCFDEDSDKTCLFTSRYKEILEKNIDSLIKAEYSNKSYTYLKNELKKKENSYDYWLKEDGNGNKLNNLTIELLKSKTKIIEDLIIEKFPQEKRASYNKTNY